MRRRDLLILMAASPAFAPRGAHAAAALPLGLQSYTIVKLLDTDFDATLALVAALGYTELETLGSFGRDPARVEEALARHGLTTPSQHLMPGDLYAHFSVKPKDDAAKADLHRRFMDGFAFDRVEAFITEAIVRAKPMRQEFIVWQVNWQKGWGLAEAKKHVDAFNTAGKLCAEAGMQFAFHNHDREFASVNGKVPYEIMVEQTDPASVKLEIDFMWAIKAGADPIAYFHKYPGRFRLCHLKDVTKDGEITGTGEGIVDFPKLIAAARAAGIEHFFFEYDRPTDPVAEIRQAATYLKPLL